MSFRPILYSSYASSCSWRVRTALELKKVDYEYRNASDPKHAEELARINPGKMIPVLVVGDAVLTESLAIVEFIEDFYPQEPHLLPKDPVKRAQSRAIALQPLQNSRVLKKVEEYAKGKSADWCHYFVQHGLEILEKKLQETAGKYSVGDDVSIADLCIPSIVYRGRLRGVDVEAFPTLMRVNTALADLEAFRAADEKHQPDSPHSAS